MKGSAPPMLTLWHCIDARSFRALWALEELGLDYQLRLLPFPPRAHDKTYFSENPLGTIPLLVDGAERLTESAAIPHYLSSVHGQGRLAVAPGQAGYGAYLNWLHHGESVLTFPQTIVLRYARFEPEARRLPQAAEDYRIWFLKRLRLLEEALADGRPHLLPEHGFTNADIVVGYALHLARQIGLGGDLPEAATAWYEGLAARPGFLRAQARQREAALAQGLRPTLF